MANEIEVEPENPELSARQDNCVLNKEEIATQLESLSLSKKAMKRLQKRKEWLETRPERRATEKAKKKAKIEKIRLEKGFTQTYTAHRKLLKQRKMVDSLCKVTVFIDMQFEALMNQRDLGKCLKQLAHCYSINRRLEQPMQFHVSSFAGDRLNKEMKPHQGYENWDCIFHCESYDEAFTKGINGGDIASLNTTDFNASCLSNVERKKNPDFEKSNHEQERQRTPKHIVYLTSESENVLNPQSIYIIGGLVDHNNHKGMCYQQAIDKGVCHARLPILESGINMKTRHVLTIDHVFKIIAAVASEKKSWNDALKETLPGRKGAVDIQDGKTIENTVKCDIDEKHSDES